MFFTQRRFDWEKEQREDYGNENANAKDLDVVSLNFDDIKFDEWDDFNDFLCSREEPFICELERWEVVTPIY